MVDEIILKDIRTILQKLRVLRNESNIEALLKESGVSKKKVSEDEILDLLARKYLTDLEMAKYSHYRAYKSKRDLQAVVDVITSLEETTSKITTFYEEIKGINTKSRAVNEEIRSLRFRFQDIPLIRIHTAYSAVERSYDSYIKTFTKTGMHRADVQDSIEKIDRSNFIVRGLKKKKAQKLKEHLETYTNSALSSIDTKKNAFFDERNKYYCYLRDVIYDLMGNDQLANALFLSAKSYGKEEISVTEDYLKVPRLSLKDLKGITQEDKVFVATHFFDFFEKKCGEKFDGDSYYQALTEFILYYYKNLVERMSYRKQKCYDEIRVLNNGQKEINARICESARMLAVFGEPLTDDQNDTYALVYTSGNK